MLETKRLMLTPTSFEDAEFLTELVNSPKWIANIGDRNVKTPEQANGFIKNVLKHLDPEKGMGQHIMSLKSTKEKVGITGIFQRNGMQNPDIGFALLERFEGNGYAFEGTKALMDLFISKKAFSRLEAITLLSNIASQKILSKLGMHHEKMIQLPNDDDELMLYARAV